jgi:hypothetical protein
MNSWKSSGFGACTPPLSTLKCGTGSRGSVPGGVSHSHSSRPSALASARALAIETPTSAFAPRRALSGVPSSSISAASISARFAPLLAAQPPGDLTADRLHRAEDTQALVTRLVPVPALRCFPAARRRPGRHPRRAGRPVRERDRHLQRGAATRVEYLQRGHIGDPVHAGTRYGPRGHVVSSRGMRRA